MTKRPATLARAPKCALASLALLLSITTTQAYACYEKAAHYYNVPAALLRAIAQIESDERPAAINTNRNGSDDLCAMQVNSWWLPKLAAYGITRPVLLEDFCACIFAGAWILAQEIHAVGYSWQAIARYHTRNPARGEAYARRVLIRARELQQQTAYPTGSK